MGDPTRSGGAQLSASILRPLTLGTPTVAGPLVINPMENPHAQRFMAESSRGMWFVTSILTPMASMLKSLYPFCNPRNLDLNSVKIMETERVTGPDGKTRSIPVKHKSKGMFGGRDHATPMLDAGEAKDRQWQGKSSVPIALETAVSKPVDIVLTPYYAHALYAKGTQRLQTDYWLLGMYLMGGEHAKRAVSRMIQAETERIIQDAIDNIHVPSANVLGAAESMNMTKAALLSPEFRKRAEGIATNRVNHGLEDVRATAKGVIAGSLAATAAIQWMLWKAHKANMAMSIKSRHISIAAATGGLVKIAYKWSEMLEKTEGGGKLRAYGLEEVEGFKASMQERIGIHSTAPADEYDAPSFTPPGFR